MADDPYISFRQAERIFREQGHRITYHMIWDRAERGLIPSETVAGRKLLRREHLPLVLDVVSKSPARQPAPADAPF
jgi:hypothetical protein